MSEVATPADLIGVYRQAELEQLMLHPEDRDLSVFDRLLDYGSDGGGVYDHFTIDVGDTYVVAVSRWDSTVSVESESDEAAVLIECLDQRLVWQDPVEADPYTMALKASTRFTVGRSGSEWRIANHIHAGGC
jgi:hypothetical protein